jgi:hypothetical protein
VSRDAILKSFKIKNEERKCGMFCFLVSLRSFFTQAEPATIRHACVTYRERYPIGFLDVLESPLGVFEMQAFAFCVTNTKRNGEHSARLQEN